MFCELLACRAVLRTWKTNPRTRRRDYRMVSDWEQGPGADEPLSYREVAWRKEVLRLRAPTAYRELFPEDAVEIVPQVRRREVLTALLQEQPFRPFWVLTADCTAVEVDRPGRVVLAAFDCLRFRQAWAGAGGPGSERTVWIALPHVRHLEWPGRPGATVIEFAG
jgi:hypothetical protein